MGKYYTSIVFILLAVLMVWDVKGETIDLAEEFACTSCNRQADSMSLVNFYQLTGGDDWFNSWDLNAPIDTWFGVLINPNGCVGVLNLRENNLVGFLPNLNLPQLTILDVSNNSLFGGLPSFSQTPFIQTLNISGNLFTGFVPELNISSLRIFFASDNMFIGPMPSFEGIPNVERINLSRNALTGNLPDLSEINNLKELLLEDNALGGNLPILPHPNLTTLSIKGNNLFGNLHNFSQNPLLEFLNISHNNFTGNFPVLQNLSALETLYINHNNFFGEIPNFMSNFRLRELRANNNKFTGHIPNFLSFANLTELNLAVNLFTSAPRFTNLPSLQALRLQGNNLTFEHLIPNIGTASNTFTYIPQDTVGQDTVVFFDVGDDYALQLEFDQGIENGFYQWYKNDELIAETFEPVFELNNLQLTDKGDYRCQVTNTQLPGLVLISRQVTLLFNGSSANDLCDFAFDITDSTNTCNDYFFFDVSFDVSQPTCGLGADNVWFRFTAKGPRVFAFIDESTFENMRLALWDFGNAPCFGDEAIELDCGDMIDFDSLTVGREYFISVVGDGSQMHTFNMCFINNSVGSSTANDEPCNARGIAPNVCLPGSTAFATPDISNPNCPMQSQNTVWYKTRLTTGMNALMLDLRDNLFFSDVSIQIGTFSGGCEGTFFPVDSYCGRAQIVQFTGLESGVDYYIQIGTEAVGGGAFILCLLESGRPLVCGANDNCSSGSNGPIDLTVFTNGGNACYRGCTTDASPGVNQGDNSCYSFYNPTVWYTFTTDELADFLDLTITSDELIRPYFALYRTNACVFFENVMCKVEGNGSVTLDGFKVDPQTRYHLAISDFYGESGEFEVCMSTRANTNVCNVLDELKVLNTSMGSPLRGPYRPGEEVSFCYKVNAWQFVSCNWLQAVIPEFGPCWDPVSFSVDGEPMQIDNFLNPFAVGEWQWLPAGEATYNVENPQFSLRPNDPLPAGWYFINQNSGVEPVLLDVNSSLGDGVRCALDTLTWEICFTLRTSGEVNCSEISNCNISIKTFTDGEVGGRERAACLSDVPIHYNAYLDCCNNPQVQPVDNTTLCSGEELVIQFDANDPDVRYNVIASPGAGITGAQSGNFGSTLTQTLTNSTFDTDLVTYTVVPEFQGCQGTPIDFEVLVFPKPDGSISVDESICEGDVATLSFELNGLPPFEIVWAEESVAPQTLNTNGTSVTTQVFPSASTSYSIVSITGQNGCINENISTSDDIEVRPTSLVEIDTIICQGEVYEFEGTTYDETGQYDIVFPGQNQFECDSTIRINLTVGDTYRDSLDADLCFGETFNIGENIFTTSGNFVAVLPSALGCDSIIFLSLRFGEEITIADTLIINDPGTGQGVINISPQGGFPPYRYAWDTGSTGNFLQNLVGGDYTVTITDQNDCSAEFTFTVETISSGFDRSLPGVESKVYPVPSQTDQQMWLDIESDRFRDIRMTIINSTGKIVDAQDLRIENGRLSHVFKSPPIPGFYLMELTYDGHSRQFLKLIIQ